MLEAYEERAKLERLAMANEFALMSEITEAISKLSDTNRKVLLQSLATQYDYESKTVKELKELLNLITLCANRLGLAYNKHLKTEPSEEDVDENDDDCDEEIDEENDDYDDEYDAYLAIKEGRNMGKSWEILLQSIWGKNGSWGDLKKPNSHKNKAIRIADKYLEDWVTDLLSKNGFMSLNRICSKIYGLPDKVSQSRKKRIAKVIAAYKQAE